MLFCTFLVSGFSTFITRHRTHHEIYNKPKIVVDISHNTWLISKKLIQRSNPANSLFYTQIHNIFIILIKEIIRNKKSMLLYLVIFF